LPSHPKYLSVVRAVTVGIATMAGINDMETEYIKLAVDEACSNVIRHAYKGDTGKKFAVKFRTTEKDLEIVLEDNGIKADPVNIKGRDLDDVRPGGLGIHFIKRAFDISEFDKKKKNGNRLRLIRHLKERDEDRDNRT
jgi:serine/threonine-protein kinase RsbW